MDRYYKIEKIGEIDAGLELHVMDRAGGFVVEMAVLVKVRAVAGRLAVKIDLSHDVVLHQCLKAVVNGGEGDIWKCLLNTHEDLVCRRVAALPHKKTIDFLPLTGHAEAVDFLWCAVWLNL